MGATVDRDAMSVSRETAFSDFHQTLTTFVEDRDDTALSRNIQTTECLIKGKHVRVCADRECGRRFLALEIKNDQFRILFTRGKRQVIFRVDQKSMTALAAGQGMTRDHLISCWINFRQFFSPIDSDKDSVRDGIVLTVSCASPKRNGRHYLIGFGVDHW